ncbi:BclA C-terminal domain-containing protein [Neobacillus drentensis]|uniref:BclA C-terminal domain-containing protein n=1 Tax=Neobacillus drentensis TaxID=220684 RepID=UPI0030002C8C
MNVPPGGNVPFNQTGECTPGDFIRNADSSITVVNAGVYLVNYNVIFNNTPATNDVFGVFALHLNGAPIPGSRFGTRVSLEDNNDGNISRLQVNGEVIVQVQNGGVLSLKNIGTSTVHIRIEVAGTPIDGAAMTIVQLDNDVE